MAQQKIKEFYEPHELTPDLLAGMADETEYRPREILNFVDPVSHDSSKIELKVLVQQVDRFANIVGFSDSSIRTEGVKTELRFISPFHVKNYEEFRLTDENPTTMQKSADGTVTVSTAAIQGSTAMQEDRRLNLLQWSLLAMINDKQFSYADGDIMVTVPYNDDIGTLTAPSVALNNSSAEIFKEILAMKNAFLRASGQRPTLAFMSATTGGKFIQIPEVNAAFRAQQSSDPDKLDDMTESFVWNGIRWVIMHEEYPSVDGTLKDPIAANRMVMTVDRVMDPNPIVSGNPFKMHRASNQLNGNDASRPYYDMFDVSKDPLAVGHRLYDNWIPMPAKRNVVFHWNNVTE